MHNGKLNKIRYNNSEKLMKQISFTVKNLRENLLKKQFIIVKRSFRSSTKHLSLDSMLGHMWIMLGTYVIIELANPLTKHTLLVIW